MKLKSLNSFELLNDKTICMITGGNVTALDSKKKDITSTNHDSYKCDNFN